jgi:hypothetical protein
MAYLQLARRVTVSEGLHSRAAQLVGDTEKAAALVRNLVSEAEGALHSVQSEMAKLRDEEKTRMRAVQPKWEVNGCIAHEKVHEINLRNGGAAATALSAAWDKSLPMAIILSETSVIDRGGHLTIKVMFLEQRRDELEFKLQYSDGANQARVARVQLSNMEVTIRQDDV